MPLLEFKYQFYHANIYFNGPVSGSAPEFHGASSHVQGMCFAPLQILDILIT